MSLNTLTVSAYLEENICSSYHHCLLSAIKLTKIKKIIQQQKSNDKKHIINDEKRPERMLTSKPVI